MKSLTDASNWATITVPIVTDPWGPGILETTFQLLANRTKWLYDNSSGAPAGSSVTLDDSAFAGNLVGVTDVQTFADTFDAFVGGGGAVDADDVTIDDAAFSGILTGVTDGQSAFAIVDAISAGAPTDAQYVVLAVDGDLSAERVLTAGHGVSITDGGANAAVTVTAVPWSPVTGFTATPASTSTITMATDHTAWVHKGDAIKMFVSVPVISKNNVIVS
jgi:hypothetical protein